MLISSLSASCPSFRFDLRCNAEYWWSIIKSVQNGFLIPIRVRKLCEIELALQVTPTAHFQKDLGLDSLDTVEVVMAFEEEFGVEIPDAEADKILSTSDAISYIAAHPQAK